MMELQSQSERVCMGQSISTTYLFFLPAFQLPAEKEDLQEKHAKVK